MNLVIPIVLGIVVLVALAVALDTLRKRPKAPPTVDLSDNAYAAAVAKWQHDYPRGLDSRADFPSVAEWKAEEAWKYQQRYGVWPENY